MENKIICELLKCEQVQNKQDINKVYYIAHVLYQNKVSKIFVADANLFLELQEIPRMTVIELYVDINLKNDGTFYLTPLAVKF